MPKDLRLLPRDAYCSAPPLHSSVRPPRLSRDVEAKSPRAPIIEVKREVTSSIESDDFKVKPPIKVEQDPRQVRVGLAALAIRPPPSTASSSVSEDAAAAAPGPSNWGVPGAALAVIPCCELGPADPPRQRGRPKGSKSRRRIAYSLDTLPERNAKVEAEGRLKVMKSNSQV